MVRFAIAGAGAIGSYIGATLSKAGEDVSLIARGAHLRAISERGLRVLDEGDGLVVRPAASDDPADIGTVDVVVITVKAHSVESIATAIGPLLGPETVVVSCQNGIPWWYFISAGAPPDNLQPARLDPRALIASAIETRRVLGSVFYPSVDMVEPGTIRRVPGSDRVLVGEPDGTESERCKAIAGALRAAGLNCSPTTQIRWELWDKLLGSGTYNMLAALTRATLRDMRNSEELRPVARAMMEEMNAVAVRVGITGLDVDRKVASNAGVGHHKMSMLQDLEMGRPLELESMIGVVLELGELYGISMPMTAALYACARALDASVRGEGE